MAAAADLDEEQEGWFEMTETSTPHIILAVNEHHEARALGPRMRKMRKATDWKGVENGWQDSNTTKGYRMPIASRDTAVYQHCGAGDA